MEIKNKFNLGDEVWQVVLYEPRGCYPDTLPDRYYAEKTKIIGIKFENWIDEEKNERISILYTTEYFGIKEENYLYATKEEAEEMIKKRESYEVEN